MKFKAAKQSRKVRQSANNYWSSLPVSEIGLKLKMTRGNNKRKDNSPRGAISKDIRQDLGGDYDDGINWNDVGTIPKQGVIPGRSVVEQLNQATQERMSERMSETRSNVARSVVELLNERASIRGSVAGGSLKGVKSAETPQLLTSMGEDTLFKTPRPEGCMRDTLIVEVRTINSEPFRGTLTYTEASMDIFQGVLGLKEEMLHGVKFAFSNCPVVRFKLLHQIDIGKLAQAEHFQLKRRNPGPNGSGIDILECKLRGIRTDSKRIGFGTVLQDVEEDPNIRWVTIDGCNYDLEEAEILAWLKIYGEVFGKLRENIHTDNNTTRKPVGTGTYSVKMRLDTPIPQLLPMYGKKIVIEFKGIQRLCTNCFGNHHKRACQSHKTQWVDYIKKFVALNPDIPQAYYGRWCDILASDPRRPGATSTVSHSSHPGSRNDRAQTQTKSSHQNANQAPLGARSTVTMNQGKDLSRNQSLKPPTRPEKWGFPQMQSTLNVTSIPQNQAESRRDPLPETRFKPSTNHNTPSKDKLNQVSLLYDDLEMNNQLADLVDIGLSVEAARELIRQEDEIDSVKQLLKEKRHQRDLEQEQKERAMHQPQLVPHDQQTNQRGHGQSNQMPRGHERQGYQFLNFK